MPNQTTLLASRLTAAAHAAQQTAAQLVAATVELAAQVAELGQAVESNLAFGKGEYHDCPIELAPIAALLALVAQGHLVIVEDNRRVMYRVQAGNAESDALLIAPIKAEESARSINGAAKWVYGWYLWRKTQNV